MRDEDFVVLLLGSNMGDSINNLEMAKSLIQQKISSIILASPIYKTEAWGNVNQNDFYNQVITLQSELDAEKLLQICLDIEKIMGRERNQKWAERIIDIDILFYGNDIIDTPNLKIPHPYLHVRRFTLTPLNDIIPNFVHPVFGVSVRQLLANCSDGSKVEQIKTENI